MANTFRLLLIDDDPRSYALVERMLSGFDRPSYQIEWVDNYVNGLERLKENQHDACLLDYRLGHQNGITLLQDAVQAGCDVPVILLTAYGSHTVDLEVMRLGSMDYLDKRQLTADLLERSVRYAYYRKKLERELQILYRERKALEQLKTDMIRIASHDIRNPVTSILMNIEMLRDEALALPAAARRRLDYIQANTMQIKTIVESFLSLEWIDEIYRQGLVRIDLVPLVEKIIADVSHKFDDKHQTFTSVIVPQAAIVDGEASQISEAILNLLLNAHRYTPEHGHIDVRLDVTDTEAIFTVRDDGYGVPDADKERIFQPFFRSANTAALEEGTGLGLHLVSNIIQRHNGQMIFSSVVGVGSEFGFRLPLSFPVDASPKATP